MVLEATSCAASVCGNQATPSPDLTIASKVAARSATNAIFMLCVILLIEVVFDIILPNPDCDEKER